MQACRYGLYGQGHIDHKKSYVYLATVTNFSQVGVGSYWKSSLINSVARAGRYDRDFS